MRTPRVRLSACAATRLASLSKASNCFAANAAAFVTAGSRERVIGNDKGCNQLGENGLECRTLIFLLVRSQTGTLLEHLLQCNNRLVAVANNSQRQSVVRIVATREESARVLVED